MDNVIIMAVRRMRVKHSIMYVRTQRVRACDCHCAYYNSCLSKIIHTSTSIEKLEAMGYDFSLTCTSLSSCAQPKLDAIALAIAYRINQNKWPK